MILVTGSKRSGTSLWMQVLIAAGFPPIGEAFPRNWGERALRDANPEGFYESVLRGGINFTTNPNPRTGAYVSPEQVTRHVCKVFIPGLVRTDLAFIGKVVATLRHWREYVTSMRRLNALDDAGRCEPAPPRMPPELEWWNDLFSLVRDISTRRYAVHVESYDRLIEDPERTVRELLWWLGEGDGDAAVAAVKSEHRHFERPDVDVQLEPGHLATFDRVFDAIRSHEPISTGLVADINRTHAALAPRIDQQRERVMAHMAARRERSTQLQPAR